MPPTLEDMASRVAETRYALEQAMDAEKQARELYELAETGLFDALEAQGLRQIRTPRGLFSMNDLAWASVEDEDKARLWAEAESPELLTLNRQRLSVLVRRALENGLELPPGVTFTTSRKITWRRT